MPGHSVARSLYTVVAGAGLGGILALLLAPGFFWAGMIGGALLFGAMRVGWILATVDDSGAGEDQNRQ